jgi:chromate reductase
MKHHIAIMVGSQREGSKNQLLSQAIQSEFASGFTMAPVNGMTDLPLYSQDLEAEGIPDLVQVMASQVRQADGLIIISPEYNYSVPGPLKNQIDWMSRVDDQPFEDKPISLMSASPSRLGGIRMQMHLRDIFVALGGRLVNRPEVAVAFVRDRISVDGQIQHEKTSDIIKSHLKDFKSLIETVA